MKKSKIKPKTKTKKKSEWLLWLPFVYDIFWYLAAVAWSNLDFPAAEFFDFAADA